MKRRDAKNMRESSTGEVSKWLKGRKSGAPPVVEGCKSREEATEAIKEQWKGVWYTKTTEWDQIGRRMKHVPKSEPGKWRRPNDEEFENAFQRAAGSGGTDGWTGKEVAMMPKGAIRWFRHMTG